VLGRQRLGQPFLFLGGEVANAGVVLPEEPHGADGIRVDQPIGARDAENPLQEGQLAVDAGGVHFVGATLCDVPLDITWDDLAP
jgi:hypothetical protein